jgi:hypothetical protein
MSSALSAYNSAVTSYKSVLSAAKSAATSTAATATGDDIVKSMASVLNSVAADSAVNSGKIASASTALSLAATTSVAANIVDDSAVQSAENAYVSALTSNATDSSALNAVSSALNTAKSVATSALATAKENANDVVTQWQTDTNKAKYADQDTSAIDNDIKQLNDLTSADNTTATKTDIDNATVAADFAALSADDTDDKADESVAFDVKADT